ncbi:bifunctional 4-hydroxy-2-oxoglutarate aldolase/2-dehydro-3-deoxy-phosphogluconate aldolase [Alkalihalobacterium alkalinitrilicum]|uniref:bifunctional 4-hydroxy-2-oxoglutarate aldolase/2-dehydro-3-deoxy-phosphogluconate aldolase n=1 Tax=Alkalihalobacterium alkalinitrilicum TaxID=427920 RepID=UPI000995BE4E|nr:bifunctional 4-hydroxy-2-oxoglutarate aldolase/2-dehydro-3-deoxy-phosphogluconate aldolase [Alkalihalobacterium alkalinitrilicum]
MGFYEWLKEYRLVAIIRGIETSSAVPVADAIHAGGVHLIEVTMNTDDAPQMISKLVDSSNGKMYIGAGTVLNKEMAKEAIAAGAQYLITPNVDEDVIKFGLERGIDVLPGVMTPTEIVKAYNAGAKMVKVFPSSSLGVSHLKELQGPLGHIPMVAVGGVNIDNVKSFFKAGAVAVGVGSSLIKKEAITQGNFDLLTQSANAFMQTIKGCDSCDS